MMAVSFLSQAQSPGYYNGTDGKTGNELKLALHNIIKDHINFSYSDAKYILEYAQEDPENSSNLIQFYTERSVAKGSSSWSTGGDYLNREHIWAKSHGVFEDLRPMDGDAFNLHAADASVNVTRSNYDFDYVEGGTYIEEADAYYGGGAFEPADRDKGAVARTLMYMAVRYEGEDGELDLELDDNINTAPNALHGKLSSLLEWNRAYPPTDFERRRNDRVEQSQNNRNPFIDNPSWADLIWADSAANAIVVSDLSSTPLHPIVGTAITIKANVANADNVKLLWGTSYSTISNEVTNAATSNLEATFTPSGIAAGEAVYCQLISSSATETDTLYTNVYLAPDATITSLVDVQGTSNNSPLEGETVTVTGIVTANTDNTFYMQSTDNQAGITVYSILRGEVGDSVVVEGTVMEYSGLTEISPATMVYSYGQETQITPDTITLSEIDESYEGKVVVFKGVVFDDGGQEIDYDGGTYSVGDGFASANVYVRYNSRLCSHTLPSGTVNLKAVVSEYSNNQQLIVDDIDWIVEVEDLLPPSLVSVELEKVSDTKVWMYVNFNEIVTEECVTEEANFFVTGDVEILRSYYTDNGNQAKIWIRNIGAGEYTLTISNIVDGSGNVLASQDYKFTSDIASGIADNILADYSIYPNPVESVFTVKSESAIQELTIYASDGRQVMTQQYANSTTVEITVDGLVSGTYFVKIFCFDGTVVERITIN